MSVLQQQILINCAPLVAPGGRLIYSTCSLEAEEDEMVVNNFLAAHAEFKLLAPTNMASLTTAEGFLRTWPQRDNCDGFFAALMVRAG